MAKRKASASRKGRPAGSRRAAPPLRDANGAARFEVADGATYVWRNVGGKAVRTLAKGTKPAKGDKVLSVTAKGVKVRTVGRRAPDPVTPAIERAAAELRAGVGLVVQLAAVKAGSRRSKELTRRIEGRTKGGRALKAPDLGRRDRQTRMGALLGIEPDSAQRPRGRGIREAVDLVVGKLAAPVGRRAEFTLKDVYGKGEGTLIRALHGSKGGLLSQLRPGGVYRATVTVHATTYDGDTITGTVTASDVIHDPGGEAMVGALASAIYHVTAREGYAMSSGSDTGSETGEGDAVDVLEVEVEVFELPSLAEGAA